MAASSLGMMSVARGAALLYTQGRPISGFSERFRYLATGELFHIPSPVMHEGEITGEFTAEEATQEKILHAALGG